MATNRKRRVSSHAGGDGKDYNGKKLTAPLTPAERKKYAHLLKNAKKK